MKTGLQNPPIERDFYDCFLRNGNTGIPPERGMVSSPMAMVATEQNENHTQANWNIIIHVENHRYGYSLFFQEHRKTKRVHDELGGSE